MQNMMTIVMVSDMSRSVGFYQGTLGLKLKFQSPEWSEFDLGFHDTRVAQRKACRHATWRRTRRRERQVWDSRSMIWTRLSRISEPKESAS